MQINESAILTPKRTEYGKAIRKKYESGAIKESRHNMTELESRNDGMSNTITTVQKDNLLLEVGVKQIGNIADGSSWDNPQAGRIYDTEGCCPTINTCQGGQREPKVVVKTKPLGNLNGHKLGSGYAGSVYDENGLSPTINTMGGGNREPMIVAMRGRNPDNPSDRTAGSPTEQRLEPNSQGICNTLTSVQKDNMVLETVKIKQATKDGYIECNVGGVADLSYPESKTRRGRVQENGEVCPTLTATETGVCRIESLYRIRKLTPLECWRLMDFSDEDFQKAESVNSNSQLYKQAGNSLVRVVMAAIMSQLNIKGVKPWNEMSDEERRKT